MAPALIGGMVATRPVTVCLRERPDGYMCGSAVRMFRHPQHGWLAGCQSCNRYLNTFRAWPELVGRVAAAVHEAENWARERADTAC